MELCTKFLESKCGEKANVCDFLDALHVKCKEFAAAGVNISEVDYILVILSLLPTHLSNFASSTLAAARLMSIGTVIDPDALISLITEEYD